jgi:nucleoside-diphosphate-sugar epimerase
VSGKALLVGGTAATGPYIVDELVAQGFDVTVYHRGTHEVPMQHDVRHLHGDPHFAESIERDLAGQTWDLAVVTYGRTRILEEQLRDRTDRLITVGGTPVLKGWHHLRNEHFAQAGGPVGVLATETYPYEQNGVDRLVDKMIETEQQLIDGHDKGYYSLTHLRYPVVYGKYNVLGFEPAVLARIRDARPVFVTIDGGQQLATRIAAPNAAHAIGLAARQPEAASGQIYNVGDDEQFTLRQWVELVASHAGHDFRFVDVPSDLVVTGALPAMDGARGAGRYHRLTSTAKIKTQLGYEDVVSPSEWVAESLAWGFEQLPPESPEDEYRLEDELIATWSLILQEQGPALSSAARFRHPYDHPASPSEGQTL